jgi:hypothetical protein
MRIVIAAVALAGLIIGPWSSAPPAQAGPAAQVQPLPSDYLPTYRESAGPTRIGSTGIGMGSGVCSRAWLS